MRRREPKNSDALALLCYAVSLGEALTLRASLEAHGVPTLIEGEHQGAVESLYASGAGLRLLVPRAALPVARELAAELIPGVGEEPSMEGEGEGEGAGILASLTPARVAFVLGAVVGVCMMVGGDPARGALVLGLVFALSYLGVLPLANEGSTSAEA